MLAELGIAILGVALLASLAGTLLGLVGALTDDRRLIVSARNALLATLPLLVGVCGLLIYAQKTGEYSIVYVTNVTNNAQPETLKVTALWGGQAGSLVFWSFMLSLFTGAVLLLNWKSQRALMPWVMVVTGVTLTFFLVINNFYENPFERFWATPGGQITTAVLPPKDAQVAYPYQSADGEFFHTANDTLFPGAVYDGHGLSPLLRHPGMVIHPPLLYLGFTGFIIPFAFAMAALATGQLGGGWIRATRRWSLVAWMFLALGLLLGGRWAYDVLGWGGYWGWDPVENSAFLPWLTGTAFLHSVMIQEKRGMLKGWNAVMILLTYLLVLFGTIATRTGLLSSVHTFAQSPLSVPMGIFLGGTILVCVVLFLWRGSQGAFKSEHAFESLLSRESLFLLNNWIFLVLAAVVFWGTWSELITGFMRDLGLRDTTINLGPEFYLKIVPYLFGALFVLMGVAPLAAWRTASAARLGRALIIPLGLTLVTMVIAVILGSPVLTSIAIGIVVFAGYATLLEIYKGVEARHRTHNEALPRAIYNLFRRNRRRYGGYTIHLGVVVLGIGVIGSTAFQEVTQQTVQPGETIQVGDYSLRYDDFFQARAVDDRTMFIADVSLYKDGKLVDNLRPRRDIFGANSSPMTIAGLHSTIENDIYVLITFWDGNIVTFRIYRNPLINFVWWGGLIFILGTIIAVWPDPEPQPARRRRPLTMARQPAGAGD